MKQSDLLEMIDHCIALCEREKAAGYPGEATQFQIEEVILPDLCGLRQKILDKDIPDDRSQRKIAAFWTPFKSWDWDMRDPTELYSSLALLQNVYRDCETLI